MKTARHAQRTCATCGRQEGGYPQALRSELHKALDAAGIKYWVAQGLTFWNCEDGRECVGYGFDASDGTPRLAVKVVGIREPGQAIAMTVGAGTCHLEECEHEREIPYDLPDCDGGWYTEITHDCDECGYENADPNIRFCGGCGAKGGGRMLMAYEHAQMMRGGDPLCPLSAVGGETFTMRCHKNCAWLVTVNNGKEAICGVIAGECGDYMGAPTVAKNPIRIGG